MFDPLGFVSLFASTAKVFLQELWRMKLDWNTIIVEGEWKKWQAELKNVSKVEIAQVHHLNSGIELHVFVMSQRRRIEL